MHIVDWLMNLHFFICLCIIAPGFTFICYAEYSCSVQWENCPLRTGSIQFLDDPAELIGLTD